MEKGTIASIVGMAAILSLALSAMAVFVPRQTGTDDYWDVDYEWDDDRDKYDVYIEELGHFTIPTKEAKLIYLPDEDIKNLAVIANYETIFHQSKKQKLQTFYINCRYKEGQK